MNLIEKGNLMLSHTKIPMIYYSKLSEYVLSVTGFRVKFELVDEIETPILFQLSKLDKAALNLLGETEVSVLCGSDNDWIVEDLFPLMFKLCLLTNYSALLIV